MENAKWQDKNLIATDAANKFGLELGSKPTSVL